MVSTWTRWLNRTACVPTRYKPVFLAQIDGLLLEIVHSSDPAFLFIKISQYINAIL